MTFSRKNLRDVFGETLVELGELNSRVLVLDADLNTSTRTVLFAERFPRRFIQCGIAEAEMLGMAAGLAAQGFIPFPATFSAFAFRKGLDQVYMNACLPGLSVKIPGSYPAATAAECGPSHNAAEDLTVFRSLPNIRVADPGDDRELRSLMLSAADSPGPVYFRVPRVEAPVLFPEEYRFEWGRGRVLREGRDVTLAGTGVASGVLLAAAEILYREGVEARVLHCASVKPLDKDLLAESAARTGRILTLEMGRKEGGFGSAVAEFIAQERPCRMRILGLGPDAVYRSAPLTDLLAYSGMTPRTVAREAAELIRADKG